MPPSQICTSCQRTCEVHTTLSPNTCEVYLVRHGETEWNRLLRLQGRTDIELNEKGCAQGRACAEQLCKERGNACALEEEVVSYYVGIYSSPLKRARQTAEIVADALGVSAGEVVIDEALLEWNLGVLEGFTAKECQANHPADWAAWANREKCGTDRVQEGESGDEVVARVTRKIQNIAKQHAGKRVIIVCHGGMLSQVKRFCLTEPNTASSVLDVEEVKNTGNKNASISVVRVHTDTQVWELVRWSDVGHLEAAGLVGQSVY
eukprot:comp7124_c0_seq1/m.2854 comp7124_c0_seq1/g.2854  ORF comp7124_c0_seq1/g.2854 comp7124_c0_seq1/m.2854 type:complete len:263 (-) comp7124_c0_seq1:48-836(-)